MYRLAISSALVAAMAGTAAAGEIEFMASVGRKLGQASTLSLPGPGGTLQENFTWANALLQAPGQFGLAVIYWPEAVENWGFGVDLAHTAAAKIEGGAVGNYDRFVFSESLLTANLYHKWDVGPARAYVGAGAGAGMAKFEVTAAAATLDALAPGVIVQGLGGASFELLPNVRLFGEARLAYTLHGVDLAGGKLDARQLSTVLRVGLSVAIDDIVGF